MTGFEPAISALTGPHVSRYTTSPFLFCVSVFSVPLNVEYFSIPFILCQVILKIRDFLLQCQGYCSGALLINDATRWPVTSAGWAATGNWPGALTSV